MKIKSLVCLLIVVLSCNVLAAFTASAGFESSVVYSGSGMIQPIMNGLAYDSGSLYVARGSNLVSINVSDNSSQVVGNMPNVAYNSTVARYDGTTYTSYSTYVDTMDYTIGYIDGAGDYQAQSSEIGIYDMAINSVGDAYFVADPLGDAQSQIFEYDLDTGAATSVATVGGYSGGLAFDSSGNLYYSDQTGGGVLKYSVDGLGVVDMSSSVSVLGVTAGYIGFDDSDNFYATTGYGSAFSQFDLTSGTIVQEIAQGGIGQFAFDGDTIYLLDTDWFVDFSSTVYAVNAVPEPATLAMLGFGAMGLLRRKRA